ncbi:MAG: hypothetical protein ACYCV4_05385 [Dermatophilaceae bacterium]
MRLLPDPPDTPYSAGLSIAYRVAAGDELGLHRIMRRVQGLPVAEELDALVAAIAILVVWAESADWQPPEAFR